MEFAVVATRRFAVAVVAVGKAAVVGVIFLLQSVHFLALALWLLASHAFAACLGAPSVVAHAARRFFIGALDVALY